MPNSDPYKYIENCRKMNAKIDEFTVKQMIIFTLKAMSKNNSYFFISFYLFRVECSKLGWIENKIIEESAKAVNLS